MSSADDGGNTRQGERALDIQLEARMGMRRAREHQRMERTLRRMVGRVAATTAQQRVVLFASNALTHTEFHRHPSIDSDTFCRGLTPKDQRTSAPASGAKPKQYRGSVDSAPTAINTASTLYHGNAGN